jgi:hypothetical protein
MALLMTSTQTWSLPQRGHMILVMNILRFHHKILEDERVPGLHPQPFGDETFTELLGQ